MKYLIGIAFICFTGILFAQKVQKEDPYYKALELRTEYFKKYNIDVDTIYVTKETYLNDYTGLLNDFYIKMVDESIIYDKTRKQKSFFVQFINPINFEEGSSVIYVTEFAITRKRKKYLRINDSGTIVSFAYDCEKGSYVFDYKHR